MVKIGMIVVCLMGKEIMEKRAFYIIYCHALILSSRISAYTTLHSLTHNILHHTARYCLLENRVLLESLSRSFSKPLAKESRAVISCLGKVVSPKLP